VDKTFSIQQKTTDFVPNIMEKARPRMGTGPKNILAIGYYEVVKQMQRFS